MWAIKPKPNLKKTGVPVVGPLSTLGSSITPMINKVTLPLKTHIQGFGLSWISHCFWMSRWQWWQREIASCVLFLKNLATVTHALATSRLNYYIRLSLKRGWKLQRIKIWHPVCLFH